MKSTIELKSINKEANKISKKDKNISLGSLLIAIGSLIVLIVGLVYNNDSKEIELLNKKIILLENDKKSSKKEYMIHIDSLYREIQKIKKQ